MSSTVLEKLKSLLADSAEFLAGTVFVKAKTLIVELGCDHLEEIIAANKVAWLRLADAIDIPGVPAALEKQIEDEIWRRIEAGARAFAAQFCSESTTPEARQLLLASVNSAELPTLAA